MQEKVIIAGSGPAGLMAAISAAQSGKSVTILEYLPSPGRKLLASGAGKCNFTNMLTAAAMADRFAPEQRRFVRPALMGFTPGMTRKFFAERGVKHILVDDFYCFPESGKASDILNVLLDEAQSLGVKIICGSRIETLKIENDLITAVKCADLEYPCDYFIAAAGGPGFPKLGGRGSLDAVLSAAGVPTVARTPALCGLKSSDPWLQDLAGIVLDDTTLTLDKHNVTRGTLLFTGSGFSGPAALDISGRTAKLLDSGKAVTLKLNIAPERRREDWLELLNNARQSNGKKAVRNIFSNVLPQAVAHALCNLAGAGEQAIANLSKSCTNALLENLTACCVNINAVESWDKAMASTGGVALNSIEPRTMQSKILSNLYLAGEFMDVDGPCGGYNIQWALSSGYLAGKLKK